MKHMPSFEDQVKTPYPFTIAQMLNVEVPPSLSELEIMIETLNSSSSSLPPMFETLPVNSPSPMLPLISTATPPLPDIASLPKSELEILVETLNQPPPMFEIIPVISPSPMSPLIPTATSPLSISENLGLGSPLSPSISTVSTGSLASAEDLLCESELNAHNESEPLEQESDSVVNSVFNSVFNEVAPDYEPILVHKQIRSSLVDYTVSEANLISQERMASFFTEYNNQVVSLNRATQLEFARLHKEHNTLLEGIMSSLYSKWTGTSLVKDKNKNSKRLLEIQNANFKSHCLKSKKQKF